MSAQHHEILIEVDPDGNVTFTVQGIRGRGCQGLAQVLAEAMGGELIDHDRTRDYARTPRIDIQQRSGRH